jgi:hypothetical protein
LVASQRESKTVQIFLETRHYEFGRLLDEAAFCRTQQKCEAKVSYTGEENT